MDNRVIAGGKEIMEETGIGIMKEADIVVIGGGPAGMAAAVEAARSGVKDIMILERDQRLGGILQQCIHNGFGLMLFGEELTGPEYAGRFIRQVNELGIEVKLDTMVLGISGDKTVTAVNSEDGLIKIKAKSVILAMGCRERSRGALNIPGSRPAGIYTAGTAQRFVNIEGYMPGREVVILGSGDIGLIMARRLTLEGAEVKMVCEIMPHPGGLNRNIVQCLDDFGIPLRLSTTVVEIHGRERVEGVTIAKVDEKGKPVPGTYEYVKCDTLLLSVGLIPENEITKAAGIDMDGATSGPLVDENAQTSCEGVFACGNVVYVHDLVDHVTMEGYRAGKSAAEYVLGKSKCQEDTGNKYLTEPEGGCFAGPVGKCPAEPDSIISNGHESICSADNAGVVRLNPGKGVRCVIPQFIHKDCRDDVKVFFRAGSVYRDVRIEAVSDGKVLHSHKRKIVVPGGMESIMIKSEKIRESSSGCIEIRIQQSEQGNTVAGWSKDMPAGSCRELTCIVCPVGCRISAVMDENGEITEIRGNSCPKGASYARTECTDPKRMVTSTVRMENDDLPPVPVKTDIPVPKDMVMDCMKEINRFRASAPVREGDVLIRNILGTGAGIVATGGTTPSY